MDNLKEAKARGQRHHLNKSKNKPSNYQPNNDKKNIISKAKTTSKSRLGCNWDRYEIGEEEYRHKLTDSTNFELLANAPISQGSYFQFKNEKVPENGPFEDVYSDFFLLNLDDLNKSIATIPFQKRSGISEDYFTESQKIILRNNAAENLDLYNSKHGKDLLKRISIVKHNEKDESDQKSKKEYSYDRDVTDGFIEALVDPITDILELNDTSFSDSNERGCNQDNVKVAESEVDLEKWLDDILDS